MGEQATDDVYRFGQFGSGVHPRNLNNRCKYPIEIRVTTTADSVDGGLSARLI